MNTLEEGRSRILWQTKNHHEGIPVFKLVILCVFDPVAGMPDKVFEAINAFENSDQAEARAIRWLTYRPKDIVMLVEE